MTRSTLTRHPKISHDANSHPHPQTPLPSSKPPADPLAFQAFKPQTFRATAPRSVLPRLRTSNLVVTTPGLGTRGASSFRENKPPLRGGFRGWKWQLAEDGRTAKGVM